jgi:hypothetical protein
MKKLATVALCGVIGILFFVLDGALCFVVDKLTSTNYIPYPSSEIYGTLFVAAILGTVAGCFAGGIIVISRSRGKKR